ncbi:MAG TPA: TIGR04283 family arsenosugar biosynthesis glycosyltransferase [Terriglobia bacterium]|nr:TIGR04283 family arsenosugar biosynthesis glycosyltransferase [Terriglobia bacterium]
MVSIVIPTYNEAISIRTVLDRLKHVRGDFEVLVADGSSTDRTREIVREIAGTYPCPLRLVESVRHRATQLNEAARQARGDIFLFLHADMLAPPETIESIEQSLREASVAGGNFQIVFEGDTFVEDFFTWCYRVRRPFGIYYGDSGVFVRRSVFERLGGFKPIPIMDDYEFIRRLERAGRTVCLIPPMLVSDRRWRAQGLFRTLSSWVWIQTLYSLGVPAERLARWYGPVRDGSGPSHEQVSLDLVRPAAGPLRRPVRRFFAGKYRP